MQSFEKLASFYLGRAWDSATGETTAQPLLYDAKDLTTHAMCVGMTGSGKTGLCACLLEEAALDGIPSIVIDPKGDMGNLLLTFPQLRPQDFAPWVDRGAAVRQGLDPAAYAENVATTWREGIKSWGQSGERIRRLRAAADFAIYTPGSTIGLPLSVMKSFGAPPAEIVDDAELLAERVEGAVSGLLALAGVDADPTTSREFSLLSNILLHAWRAGRGMELGDLIRAVQKPPFQRLGVLDLESFYPAKDRTKLAMRLNNLIASPGFAAWSTGEPLDVDRLLHTAEGRPRVSILSIAHLSEGERMFFVTSLLHEVVAWTRRQSGTGSLRAILFMDEIFGFFPPTANPPSKRPMLTLLKQARAYGLGVVLATQNPVDLDYKGLSNTGTWFLGRLQTERDKARVLDGLEGALASAGKAFDRGTLDALLSGLGKRVFLMNNVHDETPVTFHTRWALSYLRGPLSREHVQTLMGARAHVEAPKPPAAPKPAAIAAAAASAPAVPAGVQERYLRPDRELSDATVLYRPQLLATCRLHYASARDGIDQWTELTALLPLDADDDSTDWDLAEYFAGDAVKANKRPVAGARYAEPPAPALRKGSYTTWRSGLKAWLYQNRAMTLWKCRELKLSSEAGESEADFKVRVQDAAREQRDLELEKLRKKYATKIDRIQERIRKAEERIDREQDQLKQRKRESWISMGTNLVGAIFGRKLSGTTARRAGSSLRSRGRVSKEKGDVERAKAELEAKQQDLRELELELEQAVDELEDRWHPSQLEIEDKELRPRKSDIDVPLPTLLWTPWKIDSNGVAEPAHEPLGDRRR